MGCVHTVSATERGLLFRTNTVLYTYALLTYIHTLCNIRRICQHGDLVTYYLGAFTPAIVVIPSLPLCSICLLHCGIPLMLSCVFVFVEVHSVCSGDFGRSVESRCRSRWLLAFRWHAGPQGGLCGGFFSCGSWSNCIHGDAYGIFIVRSLARCIGRSVYQGSGCWRRIPPKSQCMPGTCLCLFFFNFFIILCRPQSRWCIGLVFAKLNLWSFVRFLIEACLV